MEPRNEALNMQYMHITPDYASHYKFVYGIFCGLFYSANKN